jgi:polyisoprenyl-teichoic acid--peptidoglycan teichoic acid transferase
VSPERQGGNGQGDEDQRSDETQEFQLGDEFREEDDKEPRGEEPGEETGDEEPNEGDLEEADGDEEDLDEEDLDEEHLDHDQDEDEAPELSDEEKLAQVVSAETQEWEGLEAAEAAADADEPTVVASAGAKIKQAGSAITSNFEKVGGKTTDGFKAVGAATTSGFRAVRRHIGFPIWLRFMTACFVIVASIAGATSASLILYLSDIANALQKHSVIEGVDPFLTTTTSSGPQTILIIGSDKRNQEISGKFGLSDTTMLLRLDADRGAIALLSLPRDLKVEIPGVGVSKLNDAFAYGGPKLTLRTVKQLTGLEINHLVNVDFTGFARAVNAIGCVYVDVDHRYFHQNTVNGTSADDYAEINLQPGYQALCGFDALSFARYRHTDNDIVRAARQQAFLREARAKVPPERLIEDRKKLVKIFTTYTSSDIGSAEEMLRVLRLFFDLRGAQIKEIHFEGHLGPSYVTASPEEIKTAVDQFLGSESTPGPQGSTAKPDQKVVPEQPPDFTKATPAAPKSNKGAGAATDLVQTSYGKQLAQAIKARKLKVPVYYPTQLGLGSDYAQKPRAYKINGKGDESPPHSERAAYKWVFSLPTIGDYYGFMGTRWKDPPILDNPTDEKTIGDREYKLYYDGDRLRMVAWQTDQGSFWLSNSYIETVSNTDMLKIAQNFRQLPGT